jgi:hypothetical protein
LSLEQASIHEPDDPMLRRSVIRVWKAPSERMGLKP